MNICKKCGYEWQSRVEIPKQCPKCKRYGWNE
jgi:predicted Zn-ribbon and HTH transcriptional regulator